MMMSAQLEEHATRYASSPTFATTGVLACTEYFGSSWDMWLASQVACFLGRCFWPVIS